MGWVNWVWSIEKSRGKMGGLFSLNERLQMGIETSNERGLCL